MIKLELLAGHQAKLKSPVLEDAIRWDMQNQGLGKLLLADAINRAKSAAEAVGRAGLFVDAVLF